VEAAKRQARLASGSRRYGLIVAAVVDEGRSPRSRFADLLIAATAHANHLDLYTRNAVDFTGLERFVRVIAV
jgi:predicted nucleic acid-binding protein